LLNPGVYTILLPPWLIKLLEVFKISLKRYTLLNPPGVCTCCKIIVVLIKSSNMLLLLFAG
jgi:hypothetical protein